MVNKITYFLTFLKLPLTEKYGNRQRNETAPSAFTPVRLLQKWRKISIAYTKLATEKNNKKSSKLFKITISYH